MPRSSRNRAQKRAEKRGRQAVRRSERVPATPETLAKMRPCPLLAMVHSGAMEPEEHEASMQIWNAHGALVGQLKASASAFNERTDKAHGEVGDGRDRLVTIYLEWAGEIMRRYLLQSSVVLGWIEDVDPGKWLVNDMQRRMLVLACRAWIAACDEHDRARRTERRQLQAA